MGWRELAKDTQGAGHVRHNRHDSPSDGPNVPIVPIVPGSPPLDPVRALKRCQGELAALDPAAPLHGLDAGRWRQLLADAGWLLDQFAGQAFRDGWSVPDLFGLWRLPNCHDVVTKDAWGGIADRLQGSRSLVMGSDRARWRRMFTGEPDQFARGTYPDLKPLWGRPE